MQVIRSRNTILSLIFWWFTLLKVQTYSKEKLSTKTLFNMLKWLVLETYRKHKVIGRLQRRNLCHIIVHSFSIRDRLIRAYSRIWLQTTYACKSSQVPYLLVKLILQAIQSYSKVCIFKIDTNIQRFFLFRKEFSQQSSFMGLEIGHGMVLFFSHKLCTLRSVKELSQSFSQEPCLILWTKKILG